MAKRLRKNYGKRRKLSSLVSFFFYLKRNHLWLRRFAFIWLLLIIFEIGCPVLDCREIETFDSSKQVNLHENTSSNSETAISKSNDETASITYGNSTEEHCNDECLCHVTGLTNLDFGLTNTDFHYSPTLNLYRYKPSVSVSPPTQPPKTT